MSSVVNAAIDAVVVRGEVGIVAVDCFKIGERELK